MSPTLFNRPLRIVFYRPHESIWFYPPVRHILRNIKQPKKYKIFFDFMINSGAEIYLAPTLIRGIGIKGFLRYIKDRLDIILWCFLNGIDFRRINFAFSASKVKCTDYIFFMHYGAFTHESNIIADRGLRIANEFSDISAKKIVHMTHYLYNALQGSTNLQALRPDYLVAENNLKKNSPFYNKYFDKVTGDFITLPYTLAPRFKKKRSFEQRLNKIVTTGSITYKIKDIDFIDFFEVDELQPLRRSLFEQAHLYTTEMDCLISDLNASREIKSNQNIPQHLRFAKKIAESIKGYNPQKSYYSKNIVDIYNDYVMFAVPEEICDLPAIGFVEGMACGCAFFGLDDPMYRDLGLLPGIHYVFYDGTVTNLMEKVRYYQSHSDELELIANRGCEFVLEHLNPDVVYKEFLKLLAHNVANK